MGHVPGQEGSLLLSCPGQAGTVVSEQGQGRDRGSEGSPSLMFLLAESPTTHLAPAGLSAPLCPQMAHPASPWCSGAGALEPGAASWGWGGRGKGTWNKYAGRVGQEFTLQPSKHKSFFPPCFCCHNLLFRLGSSGARAQGRDVLMPSLHGCSMGSGAHMVAPGWWAITGRRGGRVERRGMGLGGGERGNLPYWRAHCLPTLSLSLSPYPASP